MTLTRLSSPTAATILFGSVCAQVNEIGVSAVPLQCVVAACCASESFPTDPTSRPSADLLIGHPFCMAGAEHSLEQTFRKQ
jgi:hypothetical protein